MIIVGYMEVPSEFRFNSCDTGIISLMEATNMFTLCLSAVTWNVGILLAC